jgi:hypothetical protein
VSYNYLGAANKIGSHRQNKYSNANRMNSPTQAGGANSKVGPIYNISVNFNFNVNLTENANISKKKSQIPRLGSLGGSVALGTQTGPSSSLAISPLKSLKNTPRNNNGLKFVKLNSSTKLIEDSNTYRKINSKNKNKRNIETPCMTYRNPITTSINLNRDKPKVAVNIFKKKPSATKIFSTNIGSKFLN